MNELENNKRADEDSTQFPQAEPSPVYTSERLKMSTEIHGWLTFFLVFLLLGGICSAILPLVTMGNYDSSWAIAANIVFGFEALAWTIYIVCLFSARKPNAVFFAISYVGLVIVSRILSLIDGSVTSSNVASAVSGLVWNLIMLFYMIFSNQVAEVIPKPFRKVSKRDWSILVAALLIPFTMVIVGVFTGPYYDDYDDPDEINIEEYRQEQETIMKRTPLPYNERTDGRVIFKIPAGYTCESEDVDVDGTPLTLFYIENDYGNNCTICSDYDADISVANFNDYWENWKDDDIEYASYNEGLTQTYINGNYCLCRTTKYDIEGIDIYWRYYLMFNDESGKVLVASFYDADYLTGYVMELLESVRFK